MSSLATVSSLGSFGRRLFRSAGTRPTWPVLLGTALALALAVLPLVFLVLRASSVGWVKTWSLISSPHVLMLLGNTVALAATTTILCALLGVGAAWLVERTDLPGRRLWSILLVLPVAVPDFVASYGWVSLFPSVHGFFGAVLIMTLSLYPLVYLSVIVSFRKMDPLLGEMSRSLGLNAVQTFFRATLPQIWIALLGGCLLVTLGLLAEYGAFEILRFQTFTTAIFTEFTLGFNTPGACAESLVLVVLGLIVLAGEQAAAGHGHGSRSGPGASKPRVRIPLGRSKLIVVGFLMILAAVSLGIPVFSLLYWLFQGNSSTLPPASIVSALINTAGYGVAAALMSTVLALPLATFASRYRKSGGLILERLAYLPQAIPGVVVGLALVFFALQYAEPLYQSPVLLVLAYSILFIPMAMVPLRAAVSHVRPGLEEAARSLGAKPIAVFFRVSLPLLAPGLASSFALVFLSTSTELTATLLLHPTGVQTLSTQFWAYISEVSYGAAAPYAGLIVILSILPGILIAKRFESSSELTAT